MADTRRAKDAASAVAPSLGVKIAAGVREEILLGRLRPGTPLSQPRLSRQYGTSRMPVRDALRQLASEGLALITPGGAVVAPLELAEVEDAFALLAFAHGRATRRATLNATFQELTDLIEVHGRMAVAQADGDLASVVRLNWAFHRMINRMARSPRTIAVIKAVAMSVPRGYLLDFPDDAPRFVSEKKVVIEAMKVRDAAGAETQMRQHVLNAGSNLIAYFFERGLLRSDDLPTSRGGTSWASEAS